MPNLEKLRKNRPKTLPEDVHRSGLRSRIRNDSARLRIQVQPSEAVVAFRERVQIFPL